MGGVCVAGDWAEADAVEENLAQDAPFLLNDATDAEAFVREALRGCERAFANLRGGVPRQLDTSAVTRVENGWEGPAIDPEVDDEFAVLASEWERFGTGCGHELFLEAHAQLFFVRIDGDEGKALEEGQSEEVKRDVPERDPEEFLVIAFK